MIDFISVLRMIDRFGSAINLNFVDINPMNSSQFIVNGSKDTLRMYDKRKLPRLLKKFRRQPSSRSGVITNVIVIFTNNLNNGHDINCF